MSEIVITLPDELVERASQAGLLTDAALAELLRAELERRRQEAIERFFDDLDAIQAVEPRITPEEIDAEVRAYRAAYSLSETAQRLRGSMTLEEVERELAVAKAERLARSSTAPQ
jgi:hypothetical protein